MTIRIITPLDAERDYWREIWRYRELFLILAWRDVVVRYKQTAIGIAWALVGPLLTMLVLSFVFGRIAELPAGDTPYPILVFAALLPWQFFAAALVDSSNSLVNNPGLVAKIYFPRVILPTSAMVVCLVDLLLASLILVGLMLWYGFVPSPRILLLPALVALVAFCAIGPGLWFASLNVRYRDFRYIVPFVVQFGLYLSPVGYSTALVPEAWRTLYALNPMVGAIESFRWAIIGGDFQVSIPGFLLSMAVASILLLIGLRRFRAEERGFADLI